MKTKNIYILPFRKKDLILVISDPRAHFAFFKHAIDFLLPEGSKIFAAKAGIVIDIKMDSKKGGIDPKYNDFKYLNYITLKHSNGELSQYCHLQHNSAFVKLGDKVKTGQPIALSGNTGFSSTPHLHFTVGKLNKTKVGWESLKIRFKEKIDVDRTQRPVPKKYNKLMKELEKTKKELEGK